VRGSLTAMAFIEHLRRSAVSVGAYVLDHDGTLVLGNCGPAELSLILPGLRKEGYSIVSSRPSKSGTQLGIMQTTSAIPNFLRLTVPESSVPWPVTEGLFLAFLGPDGVGKTTTVDRVMTRLKPIFGEQQLFHWRPQVLKPRTQEEERQDDDDWMAINRHGDPPRGILVSLARLAGVLADYRIGYHSLIGPALDRGALVVFDRYYHDILVDSRRYRYGGPRWLLSALKAFLPPCNVLFTVLDADEDRILSRKREVSPHELRAQRRGYAELARSLHCPHIRTDFDPDQTLAEVLRGIGQHLTHRFDEKLQTVCEKYVVLEQNQHPTRVVKTA
jgi:thymidylate kinase